MGCWKETGDQGFYSQFLHVVMRTQNFIVFICKRWEIIFMHILIDLHNFKKYCKPLITFSLHYIPFSLIVFSSAEIVKKDTVRASTFWSASGPVTNETMNYPGFQISSRHSGVITDQTIPYFEKIRKYTKIYQDFKVCFYATVVSRIFFKTTLLCVTFTSGLFNN